jgi:hypothetical protein
MLTVVVSAGKSPGISAHERRWCCWRAAQRGCSTCLGCWLARWQRSWKWVRGHGGRPRRARACFGRGVGACVAMRAFPPTLWGLGGALEDAVARWRPGGFLALLPPKPDVASEDPLQCAGQRWSGELARIGRDLLARTWGSGAVRIAMIGDYGRAEGEGRDCSLLSDGPRYQLQAHVTGSRGFGRCRELPRLLGSAAGVGRRRAGARGGTSELSEPNSGGIRTNVFFLLLKRGFCWLRFLSPGC